MKEAKPKRKVGRRNNNLEVCKNLANADREFIGVVGTDQSDTT
jgi:hypothetical protein